MISHDAKAAECRALAARARDRASASTLPSVREREDRGAARWEVLAGLEDLYIRGARARSAALRDRTALAEISRD